MEIINQIISRWGLVLVTFSLYMLIRNQCVFNWQKKNLHKISQRAKKLIEAGDKRWINLYTEMPDDYDKMMVHFWVWPLDKFRKKKIVKEAE